ncbi:hypothetical protein PG991_003547 [Apiospora marii]|uniref:Lysine-specific metallo-endopeptidase domain-containing protein n=1 Tax=Apiospora marii TaxID=335849 RepID=A0ABR1S451_9PEZI
MLYSTGLRGLIAAQAMGLAMAVTVNYPDNSCTAARKTLIERELGYTRDIAKAAQGDLQKGAYYQSFFADTLRADPGFATGTEEVYGRIAELADGTSGYGLQVTCQEDPKNCVKRKWTAYMNDGKKTMNFCNAFFTPVQGPGGGLAYQMTPDLLNDCANIDIKTAQWGTASILLHELTHTGYAMGGNKGTSDYAYGYIDNRRLPLGLLDRNCKKYASQLKGALCPNANGVDGVCAGERSGDNADTYSFVAAGVYFSQQCNRDIPMPNVPNLPAPPPVSASGSAIPSSSSTLITVSRSSSVAPTPISSSSVPATISGSGIPTSSITPQSSSSINSTVPAPAPTSSSTPLPSGNSTVNPVSHRSCPREDDALVFDGDPDEPLAVSGVLLYDWVGDSNIPFERKVCSGDTTEGLSGKIDDWSNHDVANIGTLSIGGNDLGFSDLVWYCVITPNTARLGSTNRRNCVDAENKARDLMNNQGADGMRAKLRNSYLKILQKSSHYDFHLYVTSYAEFFNAETTDCDRSSFHYWWGAYNPPWDLFFNRIVYLRQDLRREFGDLVRQLNGVIADAIADANAEWGGEQVHFVDVNAPFRDHRWCERNDIHEPDANRPETWFFLSAWKDFPIEGGSGSVDTAALEIEEARATFASNATIPLPDANTCAGALGPNADPYARAIS